MNKPVPSEDKHKIVSFSLSPTMIEWLKEEEKYTGESRSELLRTIILLYRKRQLGKLVDDA